MEAIHYCANVSIGRGLPEGARSSWASELFADR